MRTMAWVWVAKGLFNWAVVLGAFRRFGDFRPWLPLQATIVFFAGVDLLAAIGLWLAAPWGGVLWLFVRVIEADSPFLVGARPRSGWRGASTSCSSPGFSLSWRASRARA